MVVMVMATHALEKEEKGEEIIVHRCIVIERAIRRRKMRIRGHRVCGAGYLHIHTPSRVSPYLVLVLIPG
jgi:hypothetical protein